MGLDNIKFAKPEHGTWRVVERAEDKFVVYDPNGEVFDTLASRTQAHAVAGRKQKDADAAARRMERPCMCCRQTFLSEGIHNRMCDRCRRLNGEYDPYGLSPRSGRPR